MRNDDDEHGLSLPKRFGDALALHYQPVASCAGTVMGMGALLRWHHHGSAVSPEAFIPIFEKSGLIVPVSRWALVQACRDAASWRKPLQITVKLSPAQFEEGDLPDLVADALVRSGLAPERLELEVSEGALTGGDMEDVVRTLARLRRKGVGVILSDFGAGESPEPLMQDLPISAVRIAGSLVGKIEASTSARSMISMVVALAHAHGRAVVAGEVETPGQLAYLATEGCDRVQGFLIGRPGPMSLHEALTGGYRASGPSRPPEHLAPAMAVT